MTTITIEKYDYSGQFVLSYTGEVLERGESWLCLRAVFEREDINLGFVTFRKGDVFIEWFFSDRWYNIFEIHDLDSGRIKGWYCNVTRPATIEETRIAADDLELDVFVMPNGTIILLDEQEFSALDLPADERMAALRAIQSLRQQVAGQEGPFRAIR
jgi:protein associated with RNAse G/E